MVEFPEYSSRPLIELRFDMASRLLIFNRIGEVTFNLPSAAIGREGRVSACNSMLPGAAV